MLNEVASVSLNSIGIAVITSIYIVLCISLCVRSGRTHAPKAANKAAISPGMISKSSIGAKTTQSSKPTTTSTTKISSPARSTINTKPVSPGTNQTTPPVNPALVAGSKDVIQTPPTSIEKNKQDVVGVKKSKSKSLIKAPIEAPLAEQPTQRPTVKEVVPPGKNPPKNGKTENGDKKGKVQKVESKSITTDLTQVNSLHRVSGSDDCTGPPELVLDRTQRSISIKIADDEDTNENIDELPMDENLSE